MGRVFDQLAPSVGTLTIDNYGLDSLGLLGSRLDWVYVTALEQCERKLDDPPCRRKRAPPKAAIENSLPKVI